MQTGANVDKFSGFNGYAKSDNNLNYLTEYANAYFSVEVDKKIELGSHVMFIGEIKESRVLNQDPPCTYAYYHKAIKPKK